MLGGFWFGIVWMVRRWFGLPTIVNECPCGLCYTVEQFRTLDGPMVDVDFPEESLEWRHCVCGSTRTIAVRKDGTFNPWKQESA
jgi:hypothetical protein